jgi:putative transcriptional regulator
MTILHHPPDTLLSAYAAGTLDQGCNALVATHLLRCGQCRAWARTTEVVGGAMIDDIPPASMTDGAFERVLKCLDEGTEEPEFSGASSDNLSELRDIPDFVRAAPAGRWRWVAPGLHLRRIALPGVESTRVFLLRSRPGAKFVSHSHTGFELTCVLSGSFSHDANRYGPGDFDLGDPDVEHTIEIGAEEACISLVAMQGKLKLNGFIGKVMQPLLAI